MRREHVTIGRKTIGYLASDPSTPASRQRPLRHVLFLHAFPLHAEMWARTLEALPEGWSGIAPDFRGFGQSTLPPGDKHRIIDFAGDMIDLLDRLEIPHAIVAGCSMGGYTLFEMIHTAHNYVAGAILVSTKATGDTDEGKAGRRAMIERLERGGVGAIADEMLPKLLGTTTQRERPDLVANARRMMESNKAETVKMAINAMMERADSTSLLAHMNMPTLIVAGAEDALIPPAQAVGMHEAIPKSRCEIMTGAGHVPNLEQAASFDALLHQFLEKL
ncbi:MAG: alpha/beta hydrolase [Vicinamibacterales bacterium]|nr:alpha/beta hydrolase [Vicinamibacterales bacterium]